LIVHPLAALDDVFPNLERILEAGHFGKYVFAHVAMGAFLVNGIIFGYEV
jgi:hypothetical protein